jgi:TonB family protein
MLIAEYRILTTAMIAAVAAIALPSGGYSQAGSTEPTNSMVGPPSGPATKALRGRPYSSDEAKGRVLVAFTIDRNGRLLESHIQKSSGSPTLDQAALDTVRREQPFPAPPPSVSPRKEKISFVVPIIFLSRPDIAPAGAR